MEELDGNLAALRQHELAQEQQELAYEAVLARVDPLIDEMNILLGQILDMAEEDGYDFEEQISEQISLELGL
jgi:hypothetical protein